MEPLDACVIGGGPAGLSAALWLGRYRRPTVVLDTGEYRNRWADQAHGVVGNDPVDPLTLLDRARVEALRYDSVRHLAARAVGARRAGDCFMVDTTSGTLRARRLILATGLVDAFPDIVNFREHYGADVQHCPACDGYEARGCRVVAYGWSTQVAGFALTLMDWASQVTVVTDGRRYEGDERHRIVLAARGVALLEDTITELIGGRGSLRGVRLGSGNQLECERLFFSVAHSPASDLPRQLGCDETPNGCVQVDRDGLTSVPGVYAVGDITPGMQLVSVAIGKGAAAGAACATSLADLGLLA